MRIGTFVSLEKTFPATPWQTHCTLLSCLLHNRRPPPGIVVISCLTLDRARTTHGNLIVQVRATQCSSGVMGPSLDITEIRLQDLVDEPQEGREVQQGSFLRELVEQFIKDGHVLVT